MCRSRSNCLTVQIPNSTNIMTPSVSNKSLLFLCTHIMHIRRKNAGFEWGQYCSQARVVETTAQLFYIIIFNRSFTSTEALRCTRHMKCRKRSSAFRRFFNFLVLIFRTTFTLDPNIVPMIRRSCQAMVGRISYRYKIWSPCRIQFFLSAITSVDHGVYFTHRLRSGIVAIDRCYHTFLAFRDMQILLLIEVSLVICPTEPKRGRASDMSKAGAYARYNVHTQLRQR